MIQQGSSTQVRIVNFTEVNLNSAEEQIFSLRHVKLLSVSLVFSRTSVSWKLAHLNVVDEIQ